MTNESFNSADKKEDNYALDDTLAGRVVQAGFAGVALSLPDYIKNPKALITSYILLLGSFTGLVGYLNAIDEDEATTPEPRSEERRVGKECRSKRETEDEKKEEKSMNIDVAQR